MANKKAALKSIAQTQRRTSRNVAIRSELKTLAKKVIAAAGTDAVKDIAIEYVSALDKAAKKRIIHANNANRHKKAVAKYIF